MNHVTCHELIDFLMEYLDGELPPERRAIFERHLSICPSCVAYLQNYKATVEMGKKAMACDGDAVAEGVPQDLVAAILAARKG
ncbi:MAG: zf-HC2 domain-containing protein [Planctomycetes bacterium]|nr:zf-HC2 domain-containing protein [Planctomycetota bacterium]